MATVISPFTKRVLSHIEKSAATNRALLDEVRKASLYLRTRHGYTLQQLQEVCDLHRNSLLRLDDIDWTPKHDTLLALTKLVERAYRVRRGEVFTFEERRGPGRPAGPTKQQVKMVAKPKRLGNGKAKPVRKRKRTQ